MNKKAYDLLANMKWILAKQTTIWIREAKLLDEDKKYGLWDNWQN